FQGFWLVQDCRWFGHHHPVAERSQSTSHLMHIPKDKNSTPLFSFAEGEILLVDKPLSWTSFDVIGKLRNTIKPLKVKVGHAGTLDPLATGLLIICTGKLTKKIDLYQAEDKEYTGIIT